MPRLLFFALPSGLYITALLIISACNEPKSFHLLNVSIRESKTFVIIAGLGRSGSKG
jgi:hypothetical protein